MEPASPNLSASPRRVARGGRLAGYNALVTGGAAGIGLATAERFALEGASVLVLDTAPGPSELPAGVTRISADVTDVDQVSEAVAIAAGERKLDVCVANAGVSLMQDFLDGTVEAWERVLRVNLLGVMLTLQTAAKRMVEDGLGGRLLATASIAGLHGEAKAAAYCASKAAVIGLIRTLAIELAPYKITVNAVAPGQIDTAMNARDLRTVASQQGRTASRMLQRHLERRVPARRLGTASEVAALYTFLASGEAEFITGEVIRIDGGELVT